MHPRRTRQQIQAEIRRTKRLLQQLEKELSEREAISTEADGHALGSDSSNAGLPKVAPFQYAVIAPSANGTFGYSAIFSHFFGGQQLIQNDSHQRSPPIGRSSPSTPDMESSEMPCGNMPTFFRGRAFSNHTGDLCSPQKVYNREEGSGRNTIICSSRWFFTIIHFHA